MNREICGQCGMPLELRDEYERLQRRLEVYGTDSDGNRVPVEYDGIDCRDETIRQLEKRLAEYEAKDGQRTREHNILVRENREQAARLAEANERIRNALDALNDDDEAGAHLILYAWCRKADSADVAPCRTCGGSGAVDAPTSSDDPSCPDCDGDGITS